MNLDIWEKHAKPPVEALKKINGGRIGGMTDINPQWRLKAMTDVFGPIGVGWYYDVVDKTTKEVGPELLVFVDINVYTKQNDDWSKPIFGTGGNKMATKESKGIHVSDECFKMALTDALSVAMKQLGIGADIYQGAWDGSKYKDMPLTPKKDEKDFATFWVALAQKEIKEAADISDWKKRHAGSLNKLKKTSSEELQKVASFVENMFPSLISCPESGKKMDVNKECKESKCSEGCPALAKFRGDK